MSRREGGTPKLWNTSYGTVSPTDDVQFPAYVNNINDKTCFVTRAITTPVGYITTIFYDPFKKTDPGDLVYMREYEYLNLKQHVDNFARMGANPPFKNKLIPRYGLWRMVGAGPDGDRGSDVKFNIVYDSSNGTVSDGDIVRCQLRAENSMHNIPD